MGRAFMSSTGQLAAVSAFLLLKWQLPKEALMDHDKWHFRVQTAAGHRAKKIQWGEKLTKEGF